MKSEVADQTKYNKREEIKYSATGKIWKLKNYSEEDALEIARSYNISHFLARLISQREPDTQKVIDYIDPKIKNLLPCPFHLKDMQKCVERLEQAIINNEKICIFADYDVDGATSSALIKNTLNQIGVNCGIYVPDRIEEGYGPTSIAMEKIHAAKYDLVITVDCGSVAFAPLEHANQLGLDVIIIDHHISLEELPRAVAIINPNRLDENSNCKDLAAVGVAFLVMVALMKYLRQQDFFSKRNIKEPNLLQQMDIVALGTVCDVMSLTGLNRAFVRQGLEVAKRRYNIGYSALCDIASINVPLNCYHLGFLLGPRINAGGRVGKSSLGASLLSTTCQDRANKIAIELDQFNQDRKVIEQDMLYIAQNIAENQRGNASLFVMQEGWHPGVIGIVAGRLKDKYNKPVSVIAINDGIAKASCRSIKGINFGLALLKAKEKDLIIAGGGHAMAAGFTASANKLNDLQDFLNEYFAQSLSKSNEHLYSHYDLDLTLSSANLDLIEELSILEPFGNGNPTPLFSFHNLFVLKADILGGKHIKALLAPSYNALKGKAIEAICFNAIGNNLDEILLSKKPLCLNVIGSLKANEWLGSSKVQINIQDIIVDK